MFLSFFCLFDIYILVCANLILVKYFSIFLYFISVIVYFFISSTKMFLLYYIFFGGSSEFTPYILNQKYSAPLQTCQNFHINKTEQIQSTL